MSAIKLSTPSSGSISLSPADTASNLVIQVPAVSGTMAIQGPAFSVYSTANQSIANNTATKIQLNTETFDTANCFDSSTNYRFTPNVAGYYQINATLVYGSAGSQYVQAKIWKNGSEIKTSFGQFANSIGGATIADVVYLNGSTDYIEFYTAQASGSTQTTAGSSSQVFMSGFLARAA
jgi:hypothetical protein